MPNFRYIEVETNKDIETMYEDDFYDECESEYAGTYAHDVEGYDDETINEAFDGDPDAYWNID